MKYWMGPVLFACILGLAACTVDHYSDPRFDRFKDTPASLIVFQSLKRQGYHEWLGEQGLTMNLRTREDEGGALVTQVDTVAFDLENLRLHARGNQGGVFIDRAYKDGRYWEKWDSELLQDETVLLENRRQLLYDYFFTALPFYLGDNRIPMEEAEPTTIANVRYDVIEIRFGDGAAFPPDPWYRLYFTHSTQRLAKVFFKATEGAQKDKYVWCELDNFGNIGGAFIPLHRIYTLASDENGAKLPGKLREQWLYKLEFGTVGEDLFTP
ncbi:MAG: hypothetical protein ACYTG7_09620 [Planctomycetota bacterium]